MRLWRLFGVLAICAAMIFMSQACLDESGDSSDEDDDEDKYSAKEACDELIDTCGDRFYEGDKDVCESVMEDADRCVRKCLVRESECDDYESCLNGNGRMYESYCAATDGDIFDGDIVDGDTTDGDLLDGDNTDGDVPETLTVANKTWQGDSGDQRYDWFTAKAFCEDLNIGGDQWRLPTISELRSLVKGCPNSETGGDCPWASDCANGDCHDVEACKGCGYGDGPANGCYWDASLGGKCGMYWSSTEYQELPSRALFVNFSDAMMSWEFEESAVYVRCVKQEFEN